MSWKNPDWGREALLEEERGHHSGEKDKNQLSGLKNFTKLYKIGITEGRKHGGRCYGLKNHSYSGRISRENKKNMKSREFCMKTIDPSKLPVSGKKGFLGGQLY